MKEVNLITFKSEEIMVDDMRNCIEIHNIDSQPNVITNSREYVPSFIEVSNVPIQRIVNRDIEHYIAVDNKVWEYMYLIKNPVTAQSQQIIIDELRDYKSKAMVTIEMKSIKIKRMVNVSWLTRFKWVFTGVNI